MRTITLLVAVAIMGCTMVPSRFMRNPAAAGCYYHVESAGKDGFVLETFTAQYSFWSQPDVPLQNGRACFKKSAARFAETQRKVIQTPSLADMEATMNRNLNDGEYSIVVTGRVRYTGDIQY